MQIELNENLVTVGVESESETDALGQALAQLIRPGTVIGLVGPLGAGKTRLVRAISEALGADSAAIASPTFVLIHEYEARLPVFHFDVYRLRSAAEFEALGPADYWGSAGVCLIEWADRVLEMLPPKRWLITIEPTGSVSRRLTIQMGPSDEVARALAERLGALPI